MTVTTEVLVSPPLSPSAFLESRRHVPTSAAPVLVPGWRRLAVLAAILAVMAVTVHWANGFVVGHLDSPIESWIIAHRTATLDWIVRRVSFFGSSRVVYTLGPLLGLVAWARCRTVGATVLAVTALRPLAEFTAKALVDRPRPDIDRMVAGVGPSFPCGHVMAAAALWGMVPIVISLYTSSRRAWRASVAVSCVVVTAIGSTRVYLGVHWPTDVVAGTIFAVLLLAGVDRVFHRAHDRLACRRGEGNLASPS
ncbi:phosphatase PAP2 family protein [Candidatus Frankia alpina]|uniref:Phosphatase PAP2 family protein n=1 Tax=Candidatus Frankia alpina TaxID=2699483 RepID=A0A4V3Z4U7_9ACTN|nr:phosphatase PAP2 family protein [Candidatus Frankia alpina]THJ63999.1 phosphatase PAP2 family protein [Candidatus Frankia alpina]